MGQFCDDTVGADSSNLTELFDQALEHRLAELIGTLRIFCPQM
jgi:hypothetical protein